MSHAAVKSTLEEQVFQGLLRAGDYLLRGEVEVLRREELTFSQYNVLRILRGARREGLSCGEIGDRMITRDSDLTRLLDRLAERKLVARSRATEDRRVVQARITDDGLELLGRLDGAVDRVHREQLAHLSRPRLETLRRLLQSVPRPGS